MTRKMQGWPELLWTLSGVSHNHLQPTITELKKSLQQEWAFVQKVTPDIGDAFVVVEMALQDAFLLSLFQVVG